LAALVDLFHSFGLIQGELLSTDGQLAPSYSRYKGCTYACEDCHAFRIDEAGQQELRDQLPSGAQRLEITCPFPEVVDKVRKAPAKKGYPQAPKVSLLEMAAVPDGAVSSPDRQQVATPLVLSD